MKTLLTFALACFCFEALAATGTIFSNITRTNTLTETNLFLTSTPVPGGTRTIYFSDVRTAVSTNLGAATATTLDTGQGANELFDMDQNVLTTSSPGFTGLGVGGIAVAGQTLTVTKDAIGVTPTGTLFLTNATAAALGAQQASPSIYLSGSGWGTTASTSQPVHYRMYELPVQGTVPSANLLVQASINNAAFTTAATISSGGNLTMGGLVTAGASGGLGVSGRSYIYSVGGDGFMEVRNNGATANSALQFNLRQVTKTANYTIVPLDSGLYYNNIGAVAAQTNTLPTAAAGAHFWFYVDAANIVSVKASGSDVIRWGSTVSGAAGDIWSSQVGSVVHLVSPKALLWEVDKAQGAWTLVAPRSGNLTLIGGTLTVANTTVTANSALFLTRKTSGGTIGFAVNYTLSTGTSFTVTSDNALDTSTYSWKLEEIPN